MNPNAPDGFLMSSRRLEYVGRVARVRDLKFVDICGAESISLRHVSGKYRETEGAPGSVWEPGSWGGCFSWG